MQVVRRKARISARAGSNVDMRRYPHRVQMYTTYPVEEVSIEELDKMVFDRIRLLKAVEYARIKFPKKGDPQFSNAIDTACKKYMPLSVERDNADLEQLFNERRKDHISHFVCRLAFCRTEEQRRWLLTQEQELFRYRIEGADMSQFLKMNDLKYDEVSDEFKKQFMNGLRDSGYNLSDEDVMQMQYFKLPFTQALELIRQRKVFLYRGYAYVPKSELVSIVCGSFRAMLSEALVITAKALPHMEEDERLVSLLREMSKTDLATDYKANHKFSGKVSVAQLDDLSRRSMPLCMRNLHENLRKEHHLKHWGRLQYGLFLKGIGITLEDVLTFWRTEFAKGKTPVDKFDKEYAYTLRHMYGKEGKRTDYTPYSCVKIIMGNGPGQGDHHGCPFKHFDEGNLRGKLRESGVNSNAITEIVKLVKENHYQVACGKYYEYTHNVAPGQEDVAINHPNRFFEISMKHYEELNAPKDNAAGGQHGGQAAGSQLHSQPTPSKPVSAASTTAPAAAMDLDS